MDLKEVRLGSFLERHGAKVFRESPPGYFGVAGVFLPGLKFEIGVPGRLWDDKRLLKKMSDAAFDVIAKVMGEQEVFGE